MTAKTDRQSIEPFVTRDGSTIRELMHPASHACRNQSLAEATVDPGAATLLHRHHRSEEFYHILAGSGEMRLGSGLQPVSAGDTVCIPSGTPHNIRNSGSEPLVFLCCCSPPYSDEDTELL